MEQKKIADGYNKLLHAVLDYIQENGIIDYKQSNMVMAYCTQSEESKKKIQYKKMEKLLNEIDKKIRKKNILIPSYLELKEREGSRLRFRGDYFSTKEIDELLEKRVESRRNGLRPQLYVFLENLIHDTKRENELLMEEQTQQRSKKDTSKDEITSKGISDTEHGKYAISETIIHEEKEDIELKKRLEEKNANDIKEIRAIMLREEEAFDKALKEGYASSFDLEKSYTSDERDRKQYLKDILRVACGQKYLMKDCKKFNRDVAIHMIRDAKNIEDLIVSNLLKINFSSSDISELYKQTLLKAKYNPHRLLEQYQKLYNNYMKQFDKLSDNEKARIKGVCKVEGQEFMPSPDDIKEKVNSRIQEAMIEHSVGVRPEDSGKLSGSYALTTYMDTRQIASIEHLIRQKEEEFYRTQTVTDYEIEEEWKKACNRNTPGVSKKSIREDLEERHEKENESIILKRNNVLKNLQYNYAAAIRTKEEKDRPLTEICRDVLQEDPMFEEQKKEEQSKALVKQEDVKGFSFSKIKEAIRKFRQKDDKGMDR